MSVRLYYRFPHDDQVHDVLVTGASDVDTACAMFERLHQRGHVPDVVAAELLALPTHPIERTIEEAQRAHLHPAIFL